jgi:DNA-binding SARP family transcriptional activator/predicted ATPase
MTQVADRLDERVTPGPAVRAVVVTLLGQFSVGVDGAAIDAESWKHRHPRLLFQMLCLAPGHQLSRDEAAEALWPQAGVRASSNRLYHTLHTLRGIFSDAGVAGARQFVQLQGGTLRLDASVPLDLDVERFRQAVHGARKRNDSDAAMAFLETARALHRDTLALSPGADDWFAPHRHALLRDQVWLHEQLAQRYEAAGRIDDVVQAVQTLAQLEPANEAAHRRLIELHAEQGRPDLAAQQYSACCRYLRRERGARPMAATQALAQRVAASKTRSAAGDAPADATPAPLRFVAPPRASPLLGRSADLDVLQSWLEEAGSRLITITAAGGVGKTRLAAALAERVQDQFRDGVHFVALGTLTQPSHLAERVIRALGLAPSGQPAEQLLLPALQARQMLLVLDCFEHLVAAAPQLSKWLDAAPQLQIVVTSQCALKSRAERVYELPTLLKKAPQAAAALFMHTARGAGVSLEPATHGALIDRVCERLGGNALAIELAAAQLARVGLADLCDALARAPLDVLVGAAPDNEPRHTSLDAAIAWSCSLLSEAEAMVLQMASVFAADFSAEDARAVLGDGVDADTVPAALRCLVARHLLSPSADAAQRDDRRFAMPDAVRAHARRHAEADPRWPAAQQRHAEHFDRVAERAYAAHRKGLPGEAGPIYRAAAADIAQSLRWQREHAATQDYLRSCWHISALRVSEGAIREVVETMEEAVRVPVHSADEKEYSAWCHYVLARVHDIESNFGASLRAARTASALARGSANAALADRIGMHLAALSLSRLRIDEALKFAERSIASLAQSPHHDLLATHYLLKAIALDLQGHHARAVAAAERGLDCAYEARHLQYITVILQTLCEIERRWGRLDRAEESLRECSALIDGADSALVRHELIVDEGALAFERGRFSEAVSHFERARESALSRRLPRVTAAELRLACVAMDSARESDAGLLLSVSEQAFPLSAHHANEYVRVRAYRLRMQAERGDWTAVQATLKRLRQLQQRTGNALWASWIAESAALVAHRLGRVEMARSALQLSKRLQADCGIYATPRQVSSWMSIDARLQQRHAGQAPPDADVVVAALEQLLPDLLHRAEAPAKRAGPAAPLPARSAQTV